jgi:hypothetical protein
MSIFVKAPQGVTVPDGMRIDEPGPDVPEHIRAFFGKTGKWWGTWTSPQVKGSYDAILVIQRIVNEEKVRIAYFTSAFPKWYIEESVWETTAQFVKREDGKTILRIPYDPSHTHIECWFAGKEFRGIMYGRFMVSRIVWKPYSTSLPESYITPSGN